MFKKSSIAALILLLLVGVMPALAQSDFTDQELEWIDYVAAALENTTATDSYRMESTQVIAQEIDMGVGMMTNTITQVVTSEQDNTQASGIPNLYGKIDQAVSVEGMGQPAQEEQSIVEMIVFDGEFYMRYENPFGGLPQGWFNFRDLPNADMYNMDSYLQLLGGQTLAQYPINADTVASIVELDSETVDGRSYRVFEMAILPEVIAGSGMFEDVFNPDAMGVDQAAFDSFLSDLINNMQQTQRIWIDPETELVYQVEADQNTSGALTADGFTVNLDQTVTISSIFFDFNEAVNIQAPELD